MSRSDLYDYSDSYIVVKATIDILAAAAAKKHKENDQAQKYVAFKSSAPFRSGISKINSTLMNRKNTSTISTAWKFRKRRPTSTTTVPFINIEINISFKDLSNFWRSLNLPLTNCEVEPDLSWTNGCTLIEHRNNITGVNVIITSSNICEVS